MSGKTDPLSLGNDPNHSHDKQPVDHTKLDYPALWLSYEDKMDELRNRFLTIASILFAVQVGILALMVDKIVLLEGQTPTPLPFIAGSLLIIFSFLTFIFFYITYTHYTSHILTNEMRSSFVQREYPAIGNFKKSQKDGQKDLQSKLRRGEKNYRKKSKLNPEEPQDPLITLKLAYIIYVVLCVFTIGMFVLGLYLNPDLQKSFWELKSTICRV